MADGARHAYLIIAHKDDAVLHALLRMLDDARNDIFIHMDAKTTSFDETALLASCRAAKVYAIPRRPVFWGTISQVNVELDLLEAAAAVGEHAYYHLLSGEDLPIKTQDEIHAFFTEHAGKEFVRFNKPMFQDGDRVWYSHAVWERLGRKKGDLAVRALDRLSVRLQKAFHFPRNADEVDFQKGTNWFSITDELARFVVGKRPWIERIFAHSLCPDELFLQTIVINSPFKNRLYHREFDNDPRAIQRLIDWVRGNPYVFRADDFQELIESDLLFARKFDAQVDARIVTMLDEHLRQGDACRFDRED